MARSLYQYRSIARSESALSNPLLGSLALRANAFWFELRLSSIFFAKKRCQTKSFAYTHSQMAGIMGLDVKKNMAISFLHV
jgi:hypothetical protein